jgi:hypothetical protein
VWTASQANREAIDAREFGMSSVAEDISKVMTADVVLALQQTSQEKLNHTMRIRVAKTRSSSTNPVVPVTMDYDRMYLEEQSAATPVTKAPEQPGRPGMGVSGRQRAAAHRVGR